tara:strand:- start:3772 stop:4161 length:390 start_codon:yes stop_codon:yes gene_type:complete
MTEDDEFKLLEQRLKQKGKTMYRPLEDKFPSTLAEIIEEDEQRAMNEHQVKVANARLSANEKQVGGVHYKAMGVEPWDVIDTWPLEQRIGFYRGNALKYIMRLGSKDQSDQEASKGLHYLEKLVEVLKE